MMRTIFLFLLVLWVLGLIIANTIGGLIHLLLFLAAAFVMIRVYSVERVRIATNSQEKMKL